MELILSAIAAGGVVGVSDQYLCLLIISIASRTGIIQLTDPMQFMSANWFIGIAALFWVLSNAPAYASLLSPGVMHIINMISNFLHGFVVPFSSALIALAAVGVIADINPELRQMLEILKVFTPDGHMAVTGYIISGASAIAGTSLTAMRAIAKPAVSASTATTASVSAPLYATIENVMSVIMMVLVYILSKVNPWLLVVLFGINVIAVLIILMFAVYQMWHFKRGIGHVLELTQTEPRAGLAIITEFFVWGSGWLAWGFWARGIVMLLAWIVVIAVFISVVPAAAAISAAFPPFGILAIFLGVMLYFTIGISTARALLKFLELKSHIPDGKKNKSIPVE